MPQTIYHLPPELQAALLRRQSARRRTALVAAGCATYELGLRGDMPAIACMCCGLGSHHPDDVRNRYCGFCQEFHSEWKEP